MKNKLYENVVSLGHFCSPALELKRIGVRKASLPFDWLISGDFKNVMELIENGFQDFLNSEYMYQLKDYPKYYRNTKYQIDFYHDFDAYEPFEKQIENVSQKYQRRIERFYFLICKPTLFIRYINSQEEAEYINENRKMILQILQEFNALNDIAFVVNEDIHISGEKVFTVKKDENDTVARSFLEKSPAMKEYILKNIAFEPVVVEKSLFFKIGQIITKMHIRLKKYYKKVYYHSKQI